MKLLHKLFPGRTRAAKVIDESVAATQSLQHSLEKLDKTILRYVSQEDECCPRKSRRQRLTDQYADAITKSKSDDHD